MNKLNTFEEFWPYYVGEHQNRLCRGLHYVGTTLVFANLGMLAATLNPWHLLGGLVSGYGFAWIGHFFVEHNRPATFTYPRWSLMADFKMYFLMLTGRMHKEVEMHRANGFRFKAGGAVAAAA